MDGVHGILLMLTGGIHVIFSLLPVTYLKDWKKFLVVGLWDTVNKDSDRAMAAFWFLVAGLLMVMVGLVLYELEHRVDNLPISIGVAFTGLTALGCIMTPRSGFTVLLLPQAIFYLYASMAPMS